MENIISFEGSVDHIIYQNTENNYVVFSLDVDFEEVMCVGTLIGLKQGDYVKVHGNWKEHKLYGEQLEVTYYEKMTPNNKEAILKYLASGVIKGVGEKTAARIVDEFGLETFNVIEKEHHKLAKIKGISKRKAEEIYESFAIQYEQREIMIYLQNFNVSAAYAMRIYKKYKEKTIEKIEKNPYKLIDDIKGIGFKIADSIAMKMGIEVDSEYRIIAVIKHILTRELSIGNVYLTQDNLYKYLKEFVKADEELFSNIILEMQMDKHIVRERLASDVVIYLYDYYNYEVYTARKLVDLNLESEELKRVDRYISEFEAQNEIILADMQKEAVKNVFRSGVSVITGGPGTGKTTIINCIIHILKELDEKYLLAAPTGRAAKRMTELTGESAYTLHRMLEINYVSDSESNQFFNRNEENPLIEKYIIVDEVSMVDINIMFHLLKAVQYGAKLILVGDVDQLPSVGPGNVLKDIIDSEVINVTKLNEIYRQKEESSLPFNAKLINEGEYPEFNKSKDFFIVRKGRAEDIAKEVVNLIVNRLPTYGDYDLFEDIQVLCPMKKTLAGVNDLNISLREALNSKEDEEKYEVTFKGITLREGDKVMQVKNNYDIEWTISNELGRVQNGSGVYNGDQGIVKSINKSKQIINVLFDDEKRVEYGFEDIDELTLSYAMTIHKSQGSEYKIVIIPAVSGPRMLMNRNLLYTAVTRAKELVVVVGREDTIKGMIENNMEFKRNSTLDLRIKEADNLY
ncbi:MAG: ATP-dependent RecD-like DNA helicase [Clostridia bacterium]|jgi:exodeoxyribonuclease V alpha subunit|nr:ATP-dependent RecD-like DNA helicase [Clostridia bacterium]